jgi:hypothetical protein
MSTPVNNNQTAAAQQIPVPTFLEKAGRTVKIIAGIVAAILGIGCMGIGITIWPLLPLNLGRAPLLQGQLFLLWPRI